MSSFIADFRQITLHTAAPGQKLCRKCESAKPLSLFYPHRSNKDRRSGSCILCHGREMRWVHIYRKYGLTEDQYGEILKHQNGRCAICQRLPEETKTSWQSNPQNLDVDHCHATGKVRGLLCADCNRLLGLAEDNPDVLRKAADYLESA